MSHERTAEFQPDGKLKVIVRNSNIDPKHLTKAWATDPHQQMIDLLKEQCGLLKKILEQTAPYKSGPQTVTIPSPVPLLPDSDSKAPQSDDSVS